MAFLDTNPQLSFSPPHPRPKRTKRRWATTGGGDVAPFAPRYDPATIGKHDPAPKTQAQRIEDTALATSNVRLETGTWGREVN